MKDILLTLLLLFACYVGFGQTQQNVNIFKHQLIIAKHDTSRVQWSPLKWAKTPQYDR